MLGIIWRHLPNERLLWACSKTVDVTQKSLGPLFDNVGVCVHQVLCPEKLESLGRLKLRLPFYSAEQLGAAFEHGPVELEVVVTMCMELRRALADAKMEETVCIACSSHCGAILNTLMLLGAFLVLEQRLPAADVCQRLLGPQSGGGQLPTLKFPTPWKAAVVHSKDALTVQDCLFGLEAAVAHGWLDYANIDLQARRETSHAKDAVPIFAVNLPSAGGPADESEAPLGNTRVTFWVAADPVTTVVRPDVRPEGPSVKEEDVVASERLGTRGAQFHGTCDGTAPRALSGGTSGGIAPGALVRGISDGDAPRAFLRVASPGSDGAHSLGSVGSVITFSNASSSTYHDPRLEWRARAGDHRRRTRHGKAIDMPIKSRVLEDAAQRVQRPEDLPAFARWLTSDLRCRLLVRANFPDEKGLPGGSYSDTFERWGVHQVSLPFPDGTAPPPILVEQLVAEVVALLQQLPLETPTLSSRQSGHEGSTEYSVMVHCKAGLGRSMSLLGALAVSLVPGLRGAAFFGWARLARPGSIQTEAQERFLRSLDEEGGWLPCVRCCRRLEKSP